VPSSKLASLEFNHKGRRRRCPRRKAHSIPLFFNVLTNDPPSSLCVVYLPNFALNVIPRSPLAFLIRPRSSFARFDAFLSLGLPLRGNSPNTGRDSVLRTKSSIVCLLMPRNVLQSFSFSTICTILHLGNDHLTQHTAMRLCWRCLQGGMAKGQARTTHQSRTTFYECNPELLLSR